MSDLVMSKVDDHYNCVSPRFCDDDHDLWTELAQREDENGAKSLGHR